MVDSSLSSSSRQEAILGSSVPAVGGKGLESN